MGKASRRRFLKAVAATGAAAWAVGAQAREGGAAAIGAELFQAGVAERDITPEPGIPLWGYADAARPATGTRDPLMARAVVFQAQGRQAAIVTLDLGRVPVRERCDRIRGQARAMGIHDVVLCASHTHAAPYMELPDLPHLDAIDATIVEVLRAAQADLKPARIGVGRCELDIAHNRRVVKNGACYMLWRNPRRLPTLPLDPEAGVVRIDGPGGKPLATLVHYACHPVILGPDNTRYSADWVGAMCKRVAKATGAPCLFVQGACGDINPHLDKTPLDAGGDKSVEAEGETAAQAVIACHKKTEAIAPLNPSVAYDEARVACGTRWDFGNPGQTAILKQAYGPMFDAYMAPYAADPSVPVGTLLLNGNLAFSFLAGEPFIRHQIDLKRDSPLRDTFLCGYANEFHAYFPTTGAAIVGGYGASSVSYVGLGAADRMITEAKIQIGTLMGRVRPLIGVSDLASVDLDPAAQDPVEWGRYWGPTHYGPVKF